MSVRSRAFKTSLSFLFYMITSIITSERLRTFLCIRLAKSCCWYQLNNKISRKKTPPAAIMTKRLQKELANFLNDPVPGMNIDKSSVEGDISV